MPESYYSVLALGMRYWFILLGLLIVWRSFRWLRRDRREKHKRLKRLPDAGHVGEFTVLAGSEELPEQSAVPVPREGVLGSVRTCDMVLPCEGVAAHHIDFLYENGEGLRVIPRRGLICAVNGTTLDHRTAKRYPPMQHGDILQLGRAALRLRLFAGLDIEHPARFKDEVQEAPAAAQRAEAPQPVPQTSGAMLPVNPYAVPQYTGNMQPVHPYAVPQNTGNMRPVNPYAVPQNTGNMRPVNPYAVPQNTGNMQPVNPYAVPQNTGNMQPVSAYPYAGQPQTGPLTSAYRQMASQPVAQPVQVQPARPSERFAPQPERARRRHRRFQGGDRT